MELNWELCRIFYQVARCRNFSRAAAMLFTSHVFFDCHHNFYVVSLFIL